VNEREAREIVEKRPDEWLSWTEKMWIAEGYLQAIEKAKGLVEALENAREAVNPDWAVHKYITETLSKWQKEK